jgi:hypothetical protein
VGSCGHANEPSGSVKGLEFLDQPNKRVIMIHKEPVTAVSMTRSCGSDATPRSSSERRPACAD